MAKVLVHLSHCSSTRPDGWSGAPGEAAWVRDLVARLKVSAAARGIDVLTVDGDLQDHPEFHDSEYKLFLAPHYESDTHGAGASGWFWGRAASSPTGAQDDAYGAIFARRFRQLPGVPPEHPEWTTVNVTDYYGFRLTRAVPGILVEHGIGNGADHDWLRNSVQAIADLHVLSMAEFLGLDTNTSVLGPTRQFTSPAGTEVWGDLYRSLAPLAGIRGEVAFAQALKETANFRFGGTAQASWNNPAGLGVTGSPDVGNRFASKEAGVRAHLGHLLWYFGPVHPVAGFCDADQRHFGAHRGLPDDVTQLNGKWAVPGIGYGESILAIAATICTPGEEMETPQQTYDRIAPLLQSNIVAPQADTNKAIKDVLASLAAADGKISDPAMRQILTTIGDALKAAGSK